MKTMKIIITTAAVAVIVATCCLLQSMDLFVWGCVCLVAGVALVKMWELKS